MLLMPQSTRGIFLVVIKAIMMVSTPVHAWWWS